MKADTVTTYEQLRSGWAFGTQWEAYGVSRLGGDTRTVLDSSDAVYNDNYVFFGVGVDYLGLFPGVRAVAQIGVSEDLNSKIHMGGPDGRTGFMTYHEIRPSHFPIYSEIYSEELYVHRYRNVLASLQTRFLYDAVVWRFNPEGAKKLVVAPMANLVLAEIAQERTITVSRRPDWEFG